MQFNICNYFIAAFFKAALAMFLHVIISRYLPPVSNYFKFMTVIVEFIHENSYICQYNHYIKNLRDDIIFNQLTKPKTK
jgi:hypothetical protein